MFQITDATCRAFTFAEVLIMAAMNVESVRVNSERRFCAGDAAQAKFARHVIRTGVQKTPLL